MEVKLELDEQTLDMLADRIAGKLRKPKPLVYTTEQLADLLHTYPQKISLWRREGLIPGIRFGNSWVFRQEAVEQFLEENEGREIGTAEKIRRK